jgi:hypothetical protein
MAKRGATVRSGTAGMRHPVDLLEGDHPTPQGAEVAGSASVDWQTAPGVRAVGLRQIDRMSQEPRRARPGIIG